MFTDFESVSNVFCLLPCPVMIFNLKDDTFVINSALNKHFCGSIEPGCTLEYSKCSLNLELQAITKLAKSNSILEDASLLLESKVVDRVSYLFKPFKISEEGGWIVVFGMHTNVSFNLRETFMASSKEDLSDFDYSYQSDLILKNLLTNLPAYVYWKDKNGVFRGCNKLLAKLSGFNEVSDLVGKTDYEVTTKEEADKIRQHDKIIIDTRKPLTAEEIAYHPGSNKKMTALSYKSPIINSNNNVVGVMGISIDISELKEAQENFEAASNERKKMLTRLTQFVDDQEHDIRTPLGGIAGGLEFIIPMVKSDPDEAIPVLEMINQSANEILDYQESLLYDLYAGDREGRTIFSRFDIADIAKRVFKVNEAVAMNKQLAYTLNYDDTIPRYLLGDGKRVYQCLLDLLGNALRFTSSGAVGLSVEYLGQLNREVVVRFSVSDTGRGIPPDKQRDILEAYVKVDPSNRGGERGRGLGLTRVCRYANQIGGELRIDSEMGKGSCFRLVLPFKISLDQTDTG